MENSNLPDGYMTLDQIQIILGTCRTTTLSYVKSLPKEFYDMQKLDNGIVFRYIVREDALPLLQSFNSILPKDLVPSSQIYAELNIPSQVFFTFIKRQGYYDKSIKQGRRNKKYHRIYFTKIDADQIIELYKNRETKRVKYNLNTFIANQFITNDFVEFLKQHIEVIQDQNEFFVYPNQPMSKLIHKYMNNIGYVNTREACEILKISRQALHQNMKKVNDPTVSLNISTKTKPENYILKDFIFNIEKKNRCEIDDVPNGFLAVTYLSKQLNIPCDTLLPLLDHVNYVTVKGRKLYNISETINIAKNFIKTNQQNPHIETWINLTYFAKKLGLMNQDVLIKIKEKGLDNIEYIKTRNGKPFGKQFLLNPALLELLVV